MQEKDSSSFQEKIKKGEELSAFKFHEKQKIKKWKNKNSVLHLIYIKKYPYKKKSKEYIELFVVIVMQYLIWSQK